MTKKRQFYSDFPTLETDRLILSKMHPDDSEDVFAYASDPAAPRFLRWDPHPTLDMTKRDIDDVLAGYASGEDGPRVIELKKTGRVVGSIYIYDFNETLRRAEIGQACLYGKGRFRDVDMYAVVRGETITI